MSPYEDKYERIVADVNRSPDPEHEQEPTAEEIVDDALGRRRRGVKRRTGEHTYTIEQENRS